MGKIINPGVVIAIGNQKGGVGKSVITSLEANYLNKYHKNLKTVVVDADDLQSSLYTIRERDIQDLDEKEKKNLYRLVKISSNDVQSHIETLQEEYDIIFLDLPGNLKQPGVITAYYLVDILFIPTQASALDIDSTIKFINLYKEVVDVRKKLNRNTGIFGIFSRVNSQNKDFKTLYANRNSYPIEFLDSYVPESEVTFQRYVNTVNTYQNARYEEYDDVCEEILGKILNYIQNGR